jgi:diguanylate cyclase (GGDEF)-like protein
VDEHEGGHAASSIESLVEEFALTKESHGEQAPIDWRPWFEANFVLVCIHSVDGMLIAANPPALAAAGLLPHEAIGRHFTQMGSLARSPEATARLKAMFERALRGETVHGAVTARVRGGRLVGIDSLVFPLRDACGRVAQVCTVSMETGVSQQLNTPSARMSRELRMLSGCTERLVRAQTEDELLSGVCKVIVESGGYPLAWVGAPQIDAKRAVVPLARAGPDEGYLEAARISWADMERGQGPIGRAVRERTIELCRDIESEPRMALWREEASRRGYRSLIALPLLIGSDCLGVLTVYSAHTDAFDQAEVSLMSELASDLAYGIAALRSRAERERAQERNARLARVLRMQSSITAAALRIRDRDELLREACRLAADIGGYDMAVISLVDSNGRCARPRFWTGGEQDFPLSEMLPISDGSESDSNLSSRALRTGEIAVCSDTSQSEPAIAMRETLVARGYKSLVAIPLSVEGRPVGVLTLTSKNADLLRDEEFLLLQDIRASLCVALQSQEQAVAAQFLAYFDPLTGLAKRALFCERLESVLRWREGPQDVPAVAVFDVDHLSHINDTFGRHFGDLVLQRVSERLKTHAGRDERLGYLGGGTFALIEPQLGESEGAIAALLDDSVFGEPFNIDGHSLRLSYRLGVARFPMDGSDGNTLLQHAEAALKRAKESGERYLHYQLEMHSEVAARLVLEHRLRTAIDEEQFELYYQPQVSLATGRVESIEALLRWNDPERGVLLPSHFLSVLESTGLIVPVGKWVLGRILADCEHWAGLPLPPLRVAVNVSALQLRRRDFVPTLLELNKKVHSWLGWALDLEITESVLLRDLERTSAMLRDLRAAGVRVALDDFGTGYSALGLLSKLPVDVVKIDRSFVAGLPQEPSNTLLVESIVRIAAALGLVTVAEGVETQAQYDAVRAMGCTAWQGNLHSAAVSRDELPKRLASFRPSATQVELAVTCDDL